MGKRMGGKDTGVVEFLGRWWPSNAGFVQRHRPDDLVSRFGSRNALRKPSPHGFWKNFVENDLSRGVRKA